MRIFARRTAEEPPDDGTPALYAAPAARRIRRRRQALIGAVGLLSIFGASVLVTQQVLDDRDTGRSSPAGALDPMAPAPGSLPAATAGGTTGATTGAAGEKSGTASPLRSSSAAMRPKTAEERIATARSMAAIAPSKIFRPLPPQHGAAAGAVDDVTTSTKKWDGETVKVVSARHDLSGYRELAWAADEGQKVGTARCTQRIRLSPDDKVRMHPTLLLCWRTSEAKSVYTVAVKIGGRPSKPASAAEIDRVWSKLS